MKKSRVMESIKRDLLAAQRKMTPQDRISAFITHSQFMKRMFEAGEKYRANNYRQRGQGEKIEKRQRL